MELHEIMAEHCKMYIKLGPHIECNAKNGGWKFTFHNNRLKCDNIELVRVNTSNKL